MYDAEMLPSYDEVSNDKKAYAESFYTQYCNTDHFTAKSLVEKYNDHLYVVQNPPARPLTQMELDDVYALPYMRAYHPSYEAAGDQVQPDQQPRLLWWLQLLCVDISSGKDSADKKP